MKLTLYTADCTGSPENCLYPHRVEATTPAELAAAVCRDHVAALYRDGRRSIANFMEAEVIELDCDNDHTENPEDWLTNLRLERDTALGGVAWAVTPSRHNWRQKGNKCPRPRFHLHAPIPRCTDPEQIRALKTALQQRFPFFDSAALDAGRFLFGTPVSEREVYWHDAEATIDTLVTGASAEFGTQNAERSGTAAIPEGCRNSTLHKFAARLLLRLGNTEEARQAFREKAALCTPPLPARELNAIWRSAAGFAGRMAEREDYVPPDLFAEQCVPPNAECEAQYAEQNDELTPIHLIDPEEGRLFADRHRGQFAWTRETGWLAYDGTRWVEGEAGARRALNAFITAQLEHAEDQVDAREEDLHKLGIPRYVIRKRGKPLEHEVPRQERWRLERLAAADEFRHFIVRCGTGTTTATVMSHAKDYMTLGIQAFDSEPLLLNTPCGTYDLSKGMDGLRPHDPEDLITQITAAAPGEQGAEEWQAALNTFFEGKQDLIDYVQMQVGLAAIGKVYQESIIIASGDGRNGKSTFWNTIFRVMGSYSGKISAEALITSGRVNVKTEMAELRGKRLAIASELGSGKRLDDATVKWLCSTDEIQAEKKYHDPFFFAPSHTLVLYTNNLARVDNADEGTWRRLILIPFNARIQDGGDIKNYADHLAAEAGPAVMRWIIEGAQKALARNCCIPQPDTVREATQEYRRDNDWLANYIENNCRLVGSHRQNATELYRHYRAVCRETGEYCRPTREFGIALARAGYKKVHTREGNFYYGLQIIDNTLGGLL